MLHLRRRTTPATDTGASLRLESRNRGPEIPQIPQIPRNCITRHESVSGAVVLLGHDRAGQVQIEVRIPDAESAAPELLGALLGWFLDLHTTAEAPEIRRAAARTLPSSPAE